MLETQLPMSGLTWLLDHLVHLVVLLDQEFGAIADVETLMDEDRCLSPPL